MNRYTYYFLLTTMAGAPILSGCSGDKSEAATKAPPLERVSDTHGEGESHAGETGEITLSPEQQAQAGIAVAPVRTEELTMPIIVPARIVPNESGQAMAGAVVSGRISRLLIAEGEAVSRGEALAVVESPEVGRLQGELLRARAAVERAGQEYERQEQLFKEGLSAERLLEQAREAYRAAQADLAAVEAQLRTLGATPATSEQHVTGDVAVRAPIAGVVSRRQATLGAYVDANEVLYEIVAPGAVYADAEVPPEQAAVLRPGLPAVIVGPGGTRFRSEVASVAPALEAETRTARVRLRILNATEALRPETFVNVEFQGEIGREALVVPATAVERVGEEVFVYRVAEEPNTYERVAVKTGEAAGDAIEVLSGLDAGDQVVTEGVFYLRSLRQKGQLSEHED